MVDQIERGQECVAVGRTATKPMLSARARARSAAIAGRTTTVGHRQGHGPRVLEQCRAGRVRHCDRFEVEVVLYRERAGDSPIKKRDHETAARRRAETTGSMAFGPTPTYGERTLAHRASAPMLPKRHTQWNIPHAIRVKPSQSPDSIRSSPPAASCAPRAQIRPPVRRVPVQHRITLRHRLERPVDEPGPDEP